MNLKTVEVWQDSETSYSIMNSGRAYTSLPFLPMLNLFDFMPLPLQAVASVFLKCLFRRSSARPQFPYLPSSFLIISRFLTPTHFLTKAFLVIPGNCSSFAFFCLPCDLQFCLHLCIPSQFVSLPLFQFLFWPSLSIFLICCLLEIWHFCFLNSNLPFLLQLKVWRDEQPSITPTFQHQLQR